MVGAAITPLSSPASTSRGRSCRSSLVLRLLRASMGHAGSQVRRAREGRRDHGQVTGRPRQDPRRSDEVRLTTSVCSKKAAAFGSRLFLFFVYYRGGLAFGIAFCARGASQEPAGVTLGATTAATRFGRAAQKRPAFLAGPLRALSSRSPRLRYRPRG
jgi:hypothetical protein